jgi:hypothetical protein
MLQVVKAVNLADHFKQIVALSLLPFFCLALSSRSALFSLSLHWPFPRISSEITQLTLASEACQSGRGQSVPGVG